ncbi:MAG: ribbon-helix-helix domain-containing protein [Thermoplasmata archaeon]|nr:ribbon-helix-helix domain-containing protein [Thermoplasmata archaeon]
MFDKSRRTDPLEPASSAGSTVGPEEERIALRCARKELQLLDSFVVSGEFRSRSELMRAALREFLRARAMSAVAPPAKEAPSGLVEVPVRLRAEEVETLGAYGTLVGNGRDIGDVLADLVRRGELELKVSELVERHRLAAHEAAETRVQLGALRRSGEDLAKKGVLGR